MAILEVSNLKKIYTTRFGGNQVQALKNINFSVEEGEYVAIMGESGSGKGSYKHHRTKGGNNMAAVTNEKKNLNSQTEDVSEFIMLLKQMSDSDRMVIKGMMMWAAGENRPVKTV